MLETIFVNNDEWRERWIMTTGYHLNFLRLLFHGEFVVQFSGKLTLNSLRDVKPSKNPLYCTCPEQQLLWKLSAVLAVLYSQRAALNLNVWLTYILSVDWNWLFTHRKFPPWLLSCNNSIQLMFVSCDSKIYKFQVDLAWKHTTQTFSLSSFKNICW